MIKEEDVGKYFTTNGKDIWKCIWYAIEPTAGMENVETGEDVSGSIRSPNLKPFIRLIPESTLPQKED